MTQKEPFPVIKRVQEVAGKLESVTVHQPSVVRDKIRVRQEDTTTTFESLFDELPDSLLSHMEYGIQQIEDGRLDLIFMSYRGRNNQQELHISQDPVDETRDLFKSNLTDVKTYLSPSPAPVDQLIQLENIDDTTLSVTYDLSHPILNLIVERIYLTVHCNRVHIDHSNQTVELIFEGFLPTGFAGEVQDYFILNGWTFDCSECGEQTVRVSGVLRDANNAGSYVSLHCRNCFATSIVSCASIGEIFEEYDSPSIAVANLTSDVKQDNLSIDSYGPYNTETPTSPESKTITYDNDVYSIEIPNSGSHIILHYHLGPLTYSIKWAKEYTDSLESGSSSYPDHSMYCTLCSQLLTEQYASGTIRLKSFTSVQLEDRSFSSEMFERNICSECFEKFNTAYKLLTDEYSEDIIANRI